MNGSLYNAFGDLMKARNPLGQLIVDKTYDANRNVATSKDAKGNLTTYLYDPADQLITTDRPAPASDMTTDYWPDGSVKRQSDGPGQYNQYDYDPLGRLKTVTDPLARTTTYTYDLAGNLASKQAPGGSCAATPKTGCTSFTYDIADQQQTVSYSDGVTPNVTATTYDANGRRRTQTLSNGTSATWDYDSLGRLTRSDDGTGSVSYDYNLAGTRTKLAYPGGSCVAPVQKCVVYGVNDDLQVTSMTDWNAKVTQFHYDPNGNLDQTTFPASTTNVDDYGFDRADRMASVTMRQGASTLASVNPYGRDADGLVNGMTQTGLPGAASETYGYTAVNQLSTRNGATQWTYDGADNLTQVTGGYQLFDAANQLCFTAPTAGTSCASPPSGATRYTYDGHGNRATRVTSAGVTTRYGDDLGDRLNSVASPSVPGPAGEYSPLTAAARIMDTRSGLGNCGGACTTLPAGGGTRTLEVTGAGGIPSTGVDGVFVSLTAVPSTAAGYATAYAAGTSLPSTSSLYYQASQPITNGVAVKVSSAGKISLTTTSTVDLVVDVLGWYATATGASGSELTPLSPTRALNTKSGSVLGTCLPSPCARLAAGGTLAVKVAGVAGVPSTATTVAVNVTAVNPSAAGTVTAYPYGQTRPGTGNLNFRSAQTIGATGMYKVGTSGYISIYSTAAVDLTVDIQGYWLPSSSSSGSSYAAAAPQVRLFDSQNPAPASSCPANPCSPLGPGASATLQVVGGTSPVPAGASAVVINLTAISAGGPGSLTAYAADQSTAPAATSLNFDTCCGAYSNLAIVKLSPDGKLKLVLGGSAPADYIVDIVGWYTTAWAYSYNGDGLRVRKGAPDGSKTSFAWDHSASLPLLLTETAASGTTSLLYGPGGQPVAQVATDSVTTTYLHHDQLGSIRLLTNGTGSVTGSATYDPFGAVTSSTGTLIRLGFGSEYADAETGLYYMRARYYDPATGQFLTRDPIEVETREPYGYVGGNPLNLSDPAGLCWGPECWVEDAADAVTDTVTEFVDDPRQTTANLAGGVLNGITLGHARGITTELGIDDNVRWDSSATKVGGFAGSAVHLMGPTQVVGGLLSANSVIGLLQCGDSPNPVCVASNFVGGGVGSVAAFSESKIAVAFGLLLNHLRVDPDNRKNPLQLARC